MKIYDDKQNKSGMKILFLLLQMVVLMMVYIFVYAAYKVVGLSIDKYGTSVLTYIPVGLVMVIFPVLLYQYRQMFNNGRMLVATTWTMGVASLSISLLYLLVAQISG